MHRCSWGYSVGKLGVTCGKATSISNSSSREKHWTIVLTPNSLAVSRVTGTPIGTPTRTHLRTPRIDSADTIKRFSEARATTISAAALAGGENK